MSVATEDVGHLQGQAGHTLSLEIAGGRVGTLGLRWLGQQVEGAAGGAHRAGGELEVARSRRQTAVTEQQLNGTHVSTTFEQVGGEGVTQRVGRDWLLDTAAAVGLLADTLYCESGNWLACDVAGEQPILWPGNLPIGAQPLQQLRGEHDVAVLLVLALL